MRIQCYRPYWKVPIGLNSCKNRLARINSSSSTPPEPPSASSPQLPDRVSVNVNKVSEVCEKSRKSRLSLLSCRFACVLVLINRWLQSSRCIRVPLPCNDSRIIDGRLPFTKYSWFWSCYSFSCESDQQRAKRAQKHERTTMIMYIHEGCWLCWMGGPAPKTIVSWNPRNLVTLDEAIVVPRIKTGDNNRQSAIFRALHIILFRPVSVLEASSLSLSTATHWSVTHSQSYSEKYSYFRFPFDYCDWFEEGHLFGSLPVPNWIGGCWWSFSPIHSFNVNEQA